MTLYSPVTGHKYLVQVAIPAAPAPQSGYPVLYVLDGNVYWPLVRLAHRMFSQRMGHGPPEPLLIVGVGYPDVKGLDENARAEDYTPPTPNNNHGRSERDYGGAPQFLTFIRQRLQPTINNHYSVNKDAQAILGHSFGGLFVLYTLLTRPDTFDRYLAISPSLWWGQGNLQTYLPADSEQGNLPIENTMANRCLLVGVGEHERRQDAVMADYARRLTLRLRQLYPRLENELVIFEGEHHGTTMWPAARRALTWIDTCNPKQK